MSRKPPPVFPTNERIAYKVDEAAALLAVSRQLIYDAINDGSLHTTVLGQSATRILRLDLLRYACRKRRKK